MKLLFLFTVVIYASAACSQASDPGPSDAGRSDPTGFTFETLERGFASFGWSGQLHQVKGAVGTPFAVKTIACDDYGVCRFAGPEDPPNRVKRRRCLLRTNWTCETDDDCVVKENGDIKEDYTPCAYVYDAPISSPLVGADGKIGACGWSFIPLHSADGQPSIRGTFNLNSGALNLENLTILLPLNAFPPPTLGAASGFGGVCPECVNDPTPNDGIKDGTCMVSTRLAAASGRADPGIEPAGTKCDVHRYGTIAGYDGSYSMDCSVKLSRSVGPPTQFGGSFTSAGLTLEITERSPDCTAPGFEGQKCWCGMCEGSMPPTACMSSADCGGRICGNSVNLVAGNACADGICNWDEKSHTGNCMSKMSPPTTIGCYPSGSGAEIVVPGRSAQIGSLYYADTAAARCFSASASPALNNQLGLPGLVLQKRNFRIIPTFEENPQ